MDRGVCVQRVAAFGVVVLGVSKCRGDFGATCPQEDDFIMPLALDACRMQQQLFHSGAVWCCPDNATQGCHALSQRAVCVYMLQVVLQVKAAVEQLHPGTQYNSCLLNLYKDGNHHVSWHSDNEKL